MLSLHRALGKLLLRAQLSFPLPYSSFLWQLIFSSTNFSVFLPDFNGQIGHWLFILGILPLFVSGKHRLTREILMKLSKCSVPLVPDL